MQHKCGQLLQGGVMTCRNRGTRMDAWWMYIYTHTSYEHIYIYTYTYVSIWVCADGLWRKSGESQ